jgi:hypothetical protein
MGKTRTCTTLGVEGAGFALVIALLLANEIADLPHLLFGAPRTRPGLRVPLLLFGEEPTPLRHHEFMLESAAVVVISLVAMVLTWVCIRRRGELERLLLMCSWCGRVRMDHRWMRLETYLQETQAVTATPGLCPACYTKQTPPPAP